MPNLNAEEDTKVKGILKKKNGPTASSKVVEKKAIPFEEDEDAQFAEMARVKKMIAEDKKIVNNAYIPILKDNLKVDSQADKAKSSKGNYIPQPAKNTKSVKDSSWQLLASSARCSFFLTSLTAGNEFVQDFIKGIDSVYYIFSFEIYSFIVD